MECLSLCRTGFCVEGLGGSTWNGWIALWRDRVALHSAVCTEGLDVSMEGPQHFWRLINTIAVFIITRSGCLQTCVTEVADYRLVLQRWLTTDLCYRGGLTVDLCYRGG